MKSQDLTLFFAHSLLKISLKAEKSAARIKKWAAENPERQRAAIRKWQQVNREKILGQARNRYAESPEKCRVHCKKWQLKNPTYKAEYVKKRRQTDPSFRILESLRARLSQALAGKCKSARTVELLGCAPDECRAYLEKQFAPWMTWENYGEWEIDHIRPCASFDLSNPEQQKVCFHFSNLQPLCKIKNMRKGASYGPRN